MKKYLSLISILFIASTYAGTLIQHMSYPDQREVEAEGRPFILSEKKHTIVLGARSPRMDKRRGMFSFSVTNRANRPLDFHPQNVRVTDQWGRPVRILAEREIAGDRRQAKRARDVFYFNARTIRPEEKYIANLAIEIPMDVESELQSLHFYYEVDGETHTFSFPCRRA